MVTSDEGRTFDDEKLSREDGFFAEVNDGHTAGCGDKGDCAPDDMVEDPVNDEGVPGTVDDLPYDYGVETSAAADQELHVSRGSGWGGVGHTGADQEGTEPELGAEDERELWREGRGLRRESEEEEFRAWDVSEDEAKQLENALGDDAAEVLPDAPDGTSATGSSGGGSEE